MELVLLVLLALGLVVLLNWVSDIGTPEDNREPYWRDASGRVWALYVAGPVRHVPNHERFIHAPVGGTHPKGSREQGATPHQNPAVHTYTAIRWLLMLPLPEEREERWYPLTNSGIPLNLAAIEQRIRNAQLSRRQVVELTTMPRWAEKQAIRREHGQGV